MNAAATSTTARQKAFRPYWDTCGKSVKSLITNMCLHSSVGFSRANSWTIGSTKTTSAASESQRINRRIVSPPFHQPGSTLTPVNEHTRYLGQRRHLNYFSQ